MLQRAPETSQREILNYLSSFDMLNYMGSIVGGVMNLLRLHCMADVTNIDIREITKKISPHGYTFPILMSLKHGNSLLLSRALKMGEQ